MTFANNNETDRKLAREICDVHNPDVEDLVRRMGDKDHPDITLDESSTSASALDRLWCTFLMLRTLPHR